LIAQRLPIGTPLDPNFQYVPHEPKYSASEKRAKAIKQNQSNFHNARIDYDIRLLMTGKGGGKTKAGVAEALYWALAYPGTTGLVVEPTLKMIKRILIPEFTRILGRGIKRSPLVSGYNKQEGILEFTNGSTIFFGSTEDPESNEGASLDWIYWDEARLTKKFELSWLTLSSRLRGTGALPEGMTPSIWITTTPSPMKSDMWKTFANESDDRDRNLKIGIFSWRFDDNIALDDNYKNIIYGTNKTDAQIEAFIEGKWSSMGTGTYKFDHNRHVIDDKGLPHPDQVKTVVYGVDWGYVHPFVILAIIIDTEDRAYIVDEFHKSYFEPDMRAKKCKEFRDKWGDGTFFCGHERPEEIRKLRKLGLDARANKTKRDDGLDEMAGRFYDTDGSPRIFFHERCVSTIWECTEYDIKVKENDDGQDCYRYGIMGYLTSGGRTVQVMQKQNRREPSRRKAKHLQAQTTSIPIKRRGR